MKLMEEEELKNVHLNDENNCEWIEEIMESKLGGN